MTVRRAKLIFIAGLTHSGTTLLDGLLGRARNTVGLGEVVPLLTTESRKLFEQDRVCSCGKLTGACPFWAPVASNLASLQDSSFQAKYSALLEIFFKVFGQEAIPVDSSKSISALRKVASLNEVEVSVLHLIRDVRGWVVSRRDVDLRRERDGKKKRSRLYGNSYSRYLIWYLGNKRIRAVCRELGIQVQSISYEALVFNTQEVIGTIEYGIDSSNEVVQASKDAMQSHILLGNRRRTDKELRIAYDYRWFSRNEWLFPSIIFPWIMHYNRSWIYSPTKRT